MLFSALLLGYFMHQGNLGKAGVSPMSVYDVNIARNIVSGRGAALSVSWFCHPKKDLVRPAAGERGLIYPFLLAFLFKHRINPAAFNLLFCLLTLVVFFLLTESVFGSQVGWLSFLWLIFNPFFNWWGAFLWESPLVAFFIVLSLLILVNRKEPAWILGSGAVLGLTFWADPWYILSILAFIPGILLMKNEGESSLNRALLFTGGFFIICGPLLFLSAQVQGSPVPVHLPVYFQVKEYSQSIWYYYDSSPPSAPAFIMANLAWIIGKFFLHLYSYGLRVFVDYGTWILFLGLIPAIFIKGRNDGSPVLPEKAKPLVSFSLLYYLGISLVWSNFSLHKEPLFIALFIIPLVFHLICRVRWNEYPSGLLTASLLLMLVVNPYVSSAKGELLENLRHMNITATETPSDRGERWLFVHTGTKARTAATRPWEIYMVTGHDSGILPLDLSPEKYAEISEKTGYNYFINNDPKTVGEKFRKNLDGREIPGMTEVFEGVWERRQSGDGL